MLRFLVFNILILLAAASQLLCQQNSKNFFDLGAAYYMIFDYAEFSNIPGAPNCCPEFNTGEGGGYSIFAGYNRQITPDLFTGASFGISLSESIFKSRESTFVNYNNETTAGEFEHYMRINTGALYFQPQISYRFFKGLSVGAGVTTGLVFHKKYSQKEEIKKPEDAGTFLDENGEDTGSRTRNVNSGNINIDNSFYSAANINLAYDLQLNKKGTMYLKPEISFSLGITDYINDLNWSRNGISFAISFIYTPQWETFTKEITDTLDEETPSAPFFAEEEPIDRIIDLRNEPENDTIRDKKQEFEFVYDTTEISRKEIVQEIVKRKDTIVENNEILYADMAMELEDNPGKKFEARKFNADFTIPLLNYVFFDQNSSELPNRYKEKSSGSYMMIVYHDILNIVAKRMKESPESEIILTGKISKNEKEKDELAQKRCQKLKEYLVNNHKISTDRIKFNILDNPMGHKKKSNPSEFQRVEITSENPKILKPYPLRDTLVAFSPARAKFRSKTYADSGIKEWTFVINSKDKLYKKVIGGRRVPAEIKWNLSKSDLKQFDLEEGFSYQLQVNDSTGKNTTGDGSFNFNLSDQIAKDSLSKEVNEDHYFVLFDYNSDNVPQVAKNWLLEAKQRIKPDSEINIYGFTDKSGDPKYNMRLSKRRAEAAAEVLGITQAKIKGFGSQLDIKGEYFPESKYYSRVVEIIITNEK